MHLQKEIENLKQQTLSLSLEVERNLHTAIKALGQKNKELATVVIDFDHDIDEKEVTLEENCLKILALYQPVATDLRFVTSVIKLNSDLERIGDLAVSIAERSITLANAENISMEFDFSGIAEKTIRMFRHAIEAMVDRNSELARSVCAADDEVDSANKKIYNTVIELMKELPERTECLIQILLISRNLERIADHATNIAEEVIYMTEGEIIRHGRYE